METENALMIFVKYPERGKVKTRLAKTIGDGAAVQLYRRMAEDIVLRHKGCGEYKTIIFFDPPDRKSDVRGWLGNDLCYAEQSGRDLGERLANAFGVVFDFGVMRAVVIGSDCLDVTQEVVTKTFRRLNEKDAVIGPAEDGGYYLLGLSRYMPEIFSSIDWGTDRVLNQTISRIKQLKLSFTILEALKDIDEPADIPPALLTLLKQRT